APVSRRPPLSLCVNRVSVQFVKTSVSALVDTGSDITVISESLRRFLRVVATPWCGSALCGADGSNFSNVPLGVCNLRFTFNDEPFSTSAVVFSQCVAAFILGWDFLSSNAFVLECLTP